LEINEKINKIAWCRRVNDSHFILSTNGSKNESLHVQVVDKTIKLWKVKERNVQAVVENNRSISQKLAQTDVRIPISLPRTVPREPIVTAVPRRVFANAHAYHINSISMNPDGEMFLSADDLRINVWDLETSDQSFSILLHNGEFIPCC